VISVRKIYQSTWSDPEKERPIWCDNQGTRRAITAGVAVEVLKQATVIKMTPGRYAEPRELLVR